MTYYTNIWYCCDLSNRYNKFIASFTMMVYAIKKKIIIKMAVKKFFSAFLPYKNQCKMNTKVYILKNGTYIKYNISGRNKKPHQTKSKKVMTTRIIKKWFWSWRWRRWWRSPRVTELTVFRDDYSARAADNNENMWSHKQSEIMNDRSRGYSTPIIS